MTLEIHVVWLHCIALHLSPLISLRALFPLPQFLLYVSKLPNKILVHSKLRAAYFTDFELYHQML